MAPRSIGGYRIEGTLGRGGMGIVYLAARIEDGSRVALKTVRVPTAKILGSIRCEIHALARLRHPGIVRIVDEGLHEGLPWYAMELVEGASLRAHVEQAGSSGMTPTSPRAPDGSGWLAEATTPLHRDLDGGAVVGPIDPAGDAGAPTSAAPSSRTPAQLRRVLGVLHRLCAPLAYLHGEGIVHRDLKPENVLVRHDGLPVLVDFGIVERQPGTSGREALEGSDEIAGSLCYMAPEQAKGLPVDARADLYSLGCILYELLTDRPPFVSDSPIAILACHVHQAPLAPSARVGGISPELDDLTLRLLRKEPRERPGHAADVAREIAALLEGGVAGALPDWPADAPPPRPYLYRPRLTGREREIASLLGEVEGLADSGGVVLMAGESGAGKTRILRELAGRLSASGSGVLVGSCVPSGPPMHAFRQPLQLLADHCRERGVDEAERIFGRRGRVLSPYAPEIGGLPGQERHPDPEVLPAKEARLRLWSDLALALEAFQRKRILVVLLDDLQWADDLSLGFLERHAGRTFGVPTVLLGSYRLDEAPAGLLALASTAGRPAPVALGRLPGTSIGEIAADMLGIPEAPAAVVELLCGVAGGNPFVVAEYLRTAVEEGLLVREPRGGWMATTGRGEPLAPLVALPHLPLPDGVRELAARRLAALDPGARRLAEVAAVLGSEQSLELLQQTAGADGDALLEALAELLARQVLEQAEGGLRFVHDRILVAARESLGPERARELHRAAALAIATQPAEARDAASLARHWEMAGEPLRAAPHYLEAARGAAARYAYGAAVPLYRRALALGAGDDTTIRRELAMDALAKDARHDEAVVELEQALAGVGAGAPRPVAARLLADLAACLRHSMRPREAEARIDEATAMAGDAPSPDLESSLLITRGQIQQDLGRNEEARRSYARAVELRERTDAPRQSIGTALSHLGTAEYHAGDREAAKVAYDRALEALAASPEARSRAMILSNASLLHLEMGDAARARECIAGAIEAARLTGSRALEGSARVNLAGILDAAGDWKGARAQYAIAIPLIQTTGDLRAMGIARANLASLDLLDGDPESAEEQVADLVEEVASRGFIPVEATLRHVRGQIALARGRPAEARTELVRALELREQVKDRYGNMLTRHALATLERLWGDLAEAQTHAEVGLAEARSLGDRTGQLRGSLELARIARWSGDLAAAAAHVVAASSHVEAAGNPVATLEYWCEAGCVATTDDEARACLTRAEAVARDIELAERAEPQEAIRELRARIARGTSPRPTRRRQ